MAIGDTGSRLVGNTEFYGGLSTDAKIGIENSFADAECLDVRKSPSQMTVLPQSREIADAGVITGLITAMTQTKDGYIWALDENGKLYSIDEDNTVTSVNNTATSSGHGLIFSMQHDALWFADAHHKLYSYGDIISPRLNARSLTTFEKMDDNSEYIENSITVNYAGNYISNPDVPRNATPDITPTFYDYTCPLGLSEATADKALFLPGLAPVAEIGVYVKTKGAGSLYVVVHDKNDNIVAEATAIPAANITEGAYNWFAIAPNPSAAISAGNQANLVPWAGDLSEGGGEYHVHVFSSNTGYVLQTVTDSSLYYGMRMKSRGYVLYETYNGKHPLAVYKSVYIGNGQYVAELQSSPRNYIDDTMYLPHRLRLDDGFEVCSIATSDEYIVIGAEKYSKDSTRGFQAGKIYFWDGESDGPNYSIECNMGSPHCIYNYANITYVIVNGALYAYTGGKELIKVRTMKGTDTELSGHNTTTEVYPNMITTRREIMLIGFPSITTAQSIRHGIYGWGSIDKNYPNSFTYNYRIPEATSQYNSNNETLRLGCVYNFGDSLFYGYEITTTDGEGNTTVNPGLATVDNESGAASTFYWQSLCFDAGSPILVKDILKFGIYFDALPTGCTITPIFRIDDGDAEMTNRDYEAIYIAGKKWYKAATTATAGKKKVTASINGRFHEAQYGFIGTTANDGNTPVIKQVAAEVRILNEEAKL